MEPYSYNRRCSCARCRAHGLMGAAILITLGVLFLLQSYAYFGFNRSWPVLLLVIGFMLFLRHSAPATGHISPYSQPGPAVNPGQPWNPNAIPLQPGVQVTPVNTENNNSQVKL